eukprot:gene5410-1990_t
MQQQSCVMRVTHQEAVTNEQLIAERGEAIGEIEEDVVEIFGMMRDMNMMVEEQGVQLDVAEEHIEK